MTSLLGCHLFNRSPSCPLTPPHPHPQRGPAHSRAGIVVGFSFTGVIEPAHILPAPARPGSHPRAAGINGFTLPCLAGNDLQKRVSVCHPKPAAARRVSSRWQSHVPSCGVRCLWDQGALEGGFVIPSSGPSPDASLAPLAPCAHLSPSKEC